MKALVYTEPGRVEVQQRPEPAAGAGEVLVRVAATGICGSDVHGFLGKSARRKPGLVLGHEAVGVVASVGAETGAAGAALLNRRVAVNPLISCMRCEACATGRHSVCSAWRLLGLDTTAGAFADFVALPMRNVTLLPDSVSDAEAVMIEPLANAVHLLSHAPVHAGMFPTAVIFGGGTLGAAILAVARARGIRVLAVVEINPLRAKAAEELGAERVLNPKTADVPAEILKMTGGRGVDLALDAVGMEITRQGCAACVTRGGTVLLLGLDQGPTTLDFLDLVRREVRLQCSYAYSEKDFAAAFDLVARKVVNFTLWTDVLPMSDAQRAFEKLVKDPGDRLKIALTPQN